MVGGSRSGKTTLLCTTTIMRALKVGTSRHVILRQAQNACWTSVGLDTFPKVMRTFFSAVKYEMNKTMHFATMENGSEIWLGGLDDSKNLDKILGNEYSTIFFNECSQIGFSAVNLALTRLAQNVGLKQRAYYDLNPVGKSHWTNKLFNLKKDPATDKPLTNPEEYASFHLSPRDNSYNLSTEYLNSLAHLPPRQRMRFLEGLYADETDDALWTSVGIETLRVMEEEVPPLVRVVVAVDPSGAKDALDQAKDAIGIVVMGLGEDGHGYVLEDATLLAGPSTWARRAVACYHKWKADCIVAETNFGGAMVENVIRSIDQSINYKEVRASRGKVQRAEPVAALASIEDETHNTGWRIHHVGHFPDLEEELSCFTQLGYTGERSPNRADACFVAGTMIETLFGERPIEEIAIGDWVLTRKGYRRVLNAGKTGVGLPVRTVDISNGRKLIGTDNHPVFVVGSGFQDLNSLVWDDMLLSVEDYRSVLWIIRVFFFWMVCGIAAILIAIRGIVASTIGDLVVVGGMEGKRFIIERYGKSLMDQLQMDTTSITETKTHSTTSQAILNACRPRSTQSVIHLVTNTWNFLLAISKKFERKLLCGTDPKRVLRGTERMGKKPGKEGSEKTSGFAAQIRNVARKLKHFSRISPEKLDIAAGNVTGPLPMRLTNTMSMLLVKFVGRCFGEINTSICQRHAQISVVHNYESGIADVYNLHVDEENEYFANGILVHNCIWAATELLLGASAQGWVQFYGKIATAASLSTMERVERKRAEVEAANRAADVEVMERPVAEGMVVIAPGPFLWYCMPNNRRYMSGENCEIVVDNKEDVDRLLRSGCILKEM
jgi:hypothetical protein